jgi:hypothetical protein
MSLNEVDGAVSVACFISSSFCVDKWNPTPYNNLEGIYPKDLEHLPVQVSHHFEHFIPS